MAKIVCGANQQDCAAGITVGEARVNYKEILNIADESEIILNGDRVTDEYILQENDSLEFIQKAGDKG